MLKRLHKRRIEIEAFEIDDKTILLDGRLDDEQPRGFVNSSGEDHPAGTIHDMRLELEVAVPDFTITAARAHMAEVPHAACHETEQSVEALVGLKILGGFSGEVRRRLGGVRGCAHLRNLILAIAPVMPLAYGAFQSSKEVDTLGWISSGHVLNTCHVLREGGKQHRAVMARIAAKVGNGDSVS